MVTKRNEVCVFRAFNKDKMVSVTKVTRIVFWFLKLRHYEITFSEPGAGTFEVDSSYKHAIARARQIKSLHSIWGN